MASKSKILGKNQYKQFFQQGITHSKDWRDWIGGDKTKKSAIKICNTRTK